MAQGGVAHMMIAGAPLASTWLGELFSDPALAIDHIDRSAITTELNGVRVFPRMNSVQINDIHAQPVTASFTLDNPETVPVEGDRIRILYHSQLIFSGGIDRIQKTTEAFVVFRYLCECLDWSQILMRRMIRRNFSNTSAHGVVDEILRLELAGEPLTIGKIDHHDALPFVDVKNARAFDVLRALAGSTGQTFYVDFDLSIQMRSLTVQAAPHLLTEDAVELAGTTVKTDREGYRNVQQIVIVGTPPNDAEEPQTLFVERTNPEQIAERAAIEGGTGRYEDYEEITHPASNLLVDLDALGIGYANLRLSTSGFFRQTIGCVVRRYGFRAGQLATVTLPTFGISGTYFIQRVSTREQAGNRLIHTLEITTSSIQQRAFESWLEILQQGKIVVQGLFALVHSSAVFTTPGAHVWTVPDGITMVTFTVKGASAGGAGGAIWWLMGGQAQCGKAQGAGGGKGGNGGRCVVNVIVQPGQEFDLFIGSRGTFGTGGHVGCFATPPPTPGTPATSTTVFRDTDLIAEASGGGGGKVTSKFLSAGAPGSPGAGTGGIVTPGGGKIGGAGGGVSSSIGLNGANGDHGEILIEW